MPRMQLLVGVGEMKRFIGGKFRSLEVGKAREIGWSPVGSGSGRREEIFNSVGLASSSCMSWEWQ